MASAKLPTGTVLVAVGAVLAIIAGAWVLRDAGDIGRLVGALAIGIVLYWLVATPAGPALIAGIDTQEANLAAWARG